MDVYQAQGYESRDDYLEQLADEYDCPIETVHAVAEILGAEEDFDGLVSAMKDYERLEGGGVNRLKKNIFVSKMKLFDDTNESLAKYMGISRSRLNAKINETGGAEFTQGEIQKIKDKYNLSNDEVNAIFFN